MYQDVSTLASVRASGAPSAGVPRVRRDEDGSSPLDTESADACQEYWLLIIILRKYPSTYQFAIFRNMPAAALGKILETDY